MTPREAICQYAGWDFSEASDYRYHYGRTAVPIYTQGNEYICALSPGKKPPKKSHEGFPWNWQEATGGNAEYVKANGKIIWVSNA